MAVESQGSQVAREREIFLSALDRTGSAERAAFLDAVCADDPPLRKRVEGLHGTVAQGGNAQRAHLAVLLGDIMPAKWEGFVSVTFEVECLMEFLFIGSPSFIVDTGRFGARIGRNSPHGQESG